MTQPIKLTPSQAKGLKRNIERAQAGKGSNRSSALETALRKAKSVFDHAGNSNDLWMAKKYIDKALELLETK